MKSVFLYILTAFIWGSTWLAIKFQLGAVDPLVSVAYRFLLSAVILLVFCRITRLQMRFSTRQHVFMAMQGFFLFGFNYWLVYRAELALPSGVVSIVFSTILFWNVVNGALFLRDPIRRRVITGGLVGMIGIVLVFKDEIVGFSFSSAGSIAFLFCVISAYFASVGNIISAYNQRSGVPVVQINAYGMLYGSVMMFLLSLVLGKSFTFEWSLPYVGSLLYLSLFGSIVAFGAYLTLIGTIGADKAGYVTLIFPVIALALSTLFENYQWTVLALIGAVMIIIGNLVIIQRKTKPELVDEIKA